MPKSTEERRAWWGQRVTNNQTLRPEDLQTAGELIYRSDIEDDAAVLVDAMARDLDELGLVIGTTEIPHLKWESILDNAQRLQLVAFGLGKMCAEHAQVEM